MPNTVLFLPLCTQGLISPSDQQACASLTWTKLNPLYLSFKSCFPAAQVSSSPHPFPLVQNSELNN